MSCCKLHDMNHEIHSIEINAKFCDSIYIPLKIHFHRNAFIAYKHNYRFNIVIIHQFNICAKVLKI